MELSTLRRLTRIMRDNLMSRITGDKTNYLVKKLFPTSQLEINIMGEHYKDINEDVCARRVVCFHFNSYREGICALHIPRDADWIASLLPIARLKNSNV